MPIKPATLIIILTCKWEKEYLFIKFKILVLEIEFIGRKTI